MYEKLGYVHHKNVEQAAKALTQWMATELTLLGVFECGFIHTNFKTEQFIWVSSNKPWRTRFLEWIWIYARTVI